MLKNSAFIRLFIKKEKPSNAPALDGFLLDSISFTGSIMADWHSAQNLAQADSN